MTCCVILCLDLVTHFISRCKMDVNLANDKGDLPILWAANDNKPLTVKLLIGLGADVNGQNDKGSSALHWACRNGHVEVVRVGHEYITYRAIFFEIVPLWVILLTSN